jgi:hypothetical protein
MKGILKNTKAGWFVLYQVMRDELASGYDSIQLHPDSQTWMDGYNLYEGKEVKFELVMDKPDHRYSETPYAKTIDEDYLGCSYPDCICQGNEITDCNNRTPKQRVIMSKTQTPEQVVLGDKTALVEGMDNLNKYTQQEIPEQAKKRAANYMSLKGALESKNSQYVDFSNPNADKITTGTTNKPMENRKTSIQELFDNLEAIDIKVPIGVKKIFLEKEKEQMRKTYSQGWTTRERFDDLVPDIIYPLGLDYEEKQEYAFEQYYNNAYGK